MKIIDKNGKELILGARVQTGTTASTKKFQGTYYEIHSDEDVLRKEWVITIHILYDTAQVNAFRCWEVLFAETYQCEEVELIDG